MKVLISRLGHRYEVNFLVHFFFLRDIGFIISIASRKLSKAPKGTLGLLNFSVLVR